jgi:hypothetical protein
MSDYKGDFPASATVRMTFNTFNSDGASVTITQLATTDVFVYKDGTVLGDPDAGVTLDLNEGTGDGAHRVSVDLSSDVQYATGADYEVKFEGADIDGNEVNIFVGEFSIENRYNGVNLLTINGTATQLEQLMDLTTGVNADSDLTSIVVDKSVLSHMITPAADTSTYRASTDSQEAIRNRGDAAWTTGAGGSDRLLMVDTTIATLATQTSFTLTAGSEDDDAYNNLSIVVEDVSTATQKAVGMVLNYTGASKTITLKEALAYTIATTDKVYILAENSLKSTVANRQLDVTATGGAGIDWANVENPTTSLDLSQTDIQLVDTVTTYTGNTPQTADNDTKLTALSGTDGKALISTDAQDLSGTLDVNTKTIAADAVDNTAIKDNAISNTKLASATISNSKFAAGAITAGVIADNAIDAATFATDAISADALSAAAIDKILDEVVEGTITLRGAQKLMMAVLTGKSSGGGGSTIVFRDTEDTKNRISATVDANGNRTAVGTRDAT